jgi:photosystem II stability/assembly factor-like uncharacterized protein
LQNEGRRLYGYKKDAARKVKNNLKTYFIKKVKQKYFMNKIILVLSAVILVFIFTFSRQDCLAQWKKCTGNIMPPGGNATTIFVTGNKIFAGTNDRGLIHSTDNGANWQSDSIKNIVYSMIAFGNKTFAGTGSGIYYSIDNGNSWKLSSLQNLSILCITSYQNKLYAAAGSHGLYKSIDSGQSWIQLNTGSKTFNSITVQNGIIFGGNVIDFNSNGGIYKSTDEGQTWTYIFSERSITSIASTSDRIFAGTIINSGFFVSYNNGVTWSRTSVSDKFIYTIFIQDTIYYAGTSGGLYYSTLNDTSWRRLSLSISVLSVYAKGNCIYTGSDRDGIYISEDKGQNWVSKGWDVSSGLYSIAVHNDNLLAFTNRGIYLSSDLGNSWNCTSKSSNSGMVFNNNKIYCPGEGVSVSTNYGQTWTKILNDGTYTYTLAINGNSIVSYASGTNYYYNVLCSNNGGQTWWWDGIFYRTNISYLNAVGDIILLSCWTTSYTQVNGHFIFGDSVGGWRKLADFIHENINSMTCSGKDIYFSTGSYGIYHSTDFCSTWKNISERNDLSLLKVIDGYLYAKDTKAGLVRSSDMGSTWSTWNDGFTGKFDINSIIATDSNVFVYTDKNELWRIAKSYQSNINHTSFDVPKSYSLSQNYPNPFNAMTAFNIYIVKPGDIVLTVFDINGKKVEEIYNGRLDAGTYKVHWDASKYSSGVYFCRMKAGDYTDSKKMLLVK